MRINEEKAVFHLVINLLTLKRWQFYFKNVHVNKTLISIYMYDWSPPLHICFDSFQACWYYKYVLKKNYICSYLKYELNLYSGQELSAICRLILFDLWKSIIAIASACIKADQTNTGITRIRIKRHKIDLKMKEEEKKMSRVGIFHLKKLINQ